MHYAFQDRESLYILMDYLGGGDLRYHISRQKKFAENQSSNIFFSISTAVFFYFYKMLLESRKRYFLIRRFYVFLYYYLTKIILKV
jgi:serine/threonine protein kinase